MYPICFDGANGQIGWEAARLTSWSHSWSKMFNSDNLWEFFIKKIKLIRDRESYYRASFIFRIIFVVHYFISKCNLDYMVIGVRLTWYFVSLWIFLSKSVKWKFHIKLVIRDWAPQPFTNTFFYPKIHVRI